ncbi:UNVERIFIED_CONTAM: hypothetical protein RMT77_010240 [Armadillidium vulgare]
MALSRSEIWKYFQKISKNEAICNLCGNKYKTSGNTTNFKAHLMNKHYGAYKSVRKERPSIDTQEPSTSTAREPKEFLAAESSMTIEPVSEVISIGDENTVDITVQPEEHPSLVRESTVTPRKEPVSRSEELISQSSSVRQKTIPEAVQRIKSFEVGGSKESSLTQALLYMICKDNLPLDCTGKKGMKHFLKVAVPLYSPPGRSKLTMLVERKYESLQAIMSKKLKNTNNLSLTTDIATLTNSTRSFIVLTSYFIDEETSTFSSVCLGVKQLQPQHTAEDIAEDLNSMLDTWRINKLNIVSVKTDAGANIVAAVRSMFSGNLHVPCFAHNINLVVTKAIEKVPRFTEIKNKVKAIINYFRHSNVAMDDLRAEEKKEGRTEGTFLFPIQDVVTRWNSTYYSLERFVLLSGHIAKILLSSKHCKAPTMTTTEELLAIQEAIELLKPFESATKELSGEKYLTASMVIPMCNCLRKKMDKINPKSSAILMLKQTLCSQINERLGVLEKNELLAAATILDLRFKKLHFQSFLIAANIIHKISQEVLENLKILGNQSPPQIEDPTLKNDTTNVDLWDVHEEEAAKNTPNPPILVQGSMPNEVKLYLNQPFLPRKFDPLKFWIDSKNAFPAMFMVAMKYFTVNATSVPSERTVSLLNNVCSDERNRLTSDHLNQLVFLGALEDKFWSV